ncbi:uncharacterized protein LOC131680007 [Topomyia yanbarensis]|uniref:uncharacterized protein LOC131680007 n=1 Tax=Topomyia yanbarensis TaxID=2498891 RepID=UPI00273C1F20|nr:uncharacterized protein LOC131680007 [Topomyia yanbarensis]
MKLEMDSANKAPDQRQIVGFATSFVRFEEGGVTNMSFLPQNDVQMNENVSNNAQQDSLPETIRSILAKDKGKFQKVLTRKLDLQIVLDAPELNHMNRILTKHFFEDRILNEKRYPTWQDKQDLAIRILEEFPHLERTRLSQEAPKESYFFWRFGGSGFGRHSGIIETRVGNMQKDIPAEERQFRRKKPEMKILPPVSMYENAACLATLTPVPQNGRYISEGMANCTELHKSLLQQKSPDKYKAIIASFPHLLSFEGIMIQQAFDRLQPQYNKQADLAKLLCFGLMLDIKWSEVQSKYIKGALRIMKTLTNRGIKRTTDDDTVSIEEVLAGPFIKWVYPRCRRINVSQPRIVFLCAKD